MATKATTLKESFVVFVDMLGFGDLLEREAGSVDDLRPVFKSADGLDLVDADAPETSSSELVRRFTQFHRCLNSARERIQADRAGAVIVFSDSAFLQTNSLKRATDVARELMRNLIFRDVPARIGIGHGSFAILRFMSDSSTQAAFHVSQFLGVSVVRAHAAEQCGAKGMRILLHPELETCVEMEAIPSVISAEPTPSRLPVTRELNYLYEPGHAQHTFSGGKDLDAVMLGIVRRMMKGAPATAHPHYIETFQALNRMRAQFGRSLYSLSEFVA
jgi:hypothetical protein